MLRRFFTAMWHLANRAEQFHVLLDVQNVSTSILQANFSESTGISKKILQAKIIKSRKKYLAADFVTALIFPSRIYINSSICFITFARQIFQM